MNYLMSIQLFIFLVCGGQLYAESLKIASWNILSQEPYSSYAFQKVNNRDSLIWQQNNRISKIVEYLRALINQHKVDVICLQEVNLDKVNESGSIISFLEMSGYAVYLFDRSKENQKINQTTLVAHTKKKFAVDKIDCCSHYLPADNSGKGCSAVQLVFVGHEKGPQINVVSVHLPFNSKKTTQQLQSLESLLSDKNTVYPGLITILCGDFNWTTTSYYYQYNASLSIDKSRFPLYMKTAYENLVKTLQSYPADWQDAARSKKKQSDPTCQQSWGTLETVDYIWYGIPKNIAYKCVCTSFEQIPGFDVKKVDAYFDALIKHGFPLPFKDIVEASKNNKIERIAILQRLQDKEKLRYNNNPFKNFKAYDDFPSDHAILIAEFEIDMSDPLTQFGKALNNIAF